MNDTNEKELLETIKKYNEKNEDIYLNALTELFKKKMSKSTLHKKIRQLVEDGKLTERVVKGERGLRKCLYITGRDSEEMTTNSLLIEINKNLKMLVKFFGLSEDLCNSVYNHRRR